MSNNNNNYNNTGNFIRNDQIRIKLSEKVLSFFPKLKVFMQ